MWNQFGSLNISFSNEFEAQEVACKLNKSFENGKDVYKRELRDFLGVR